MNVNRLGQELQRLYGTTGQPIRDSEGAAAAAPAQANGSDPTNAASNTADSFQASAQVRDLARVLKIVKAAPDVRADRVASLRSQVQSGSYNVSAETLVARIFGIRGNG